MPGHLVYIPRLRERKKAIVAVRASYVGRDVKGPTGTRLNVYYDIGYYEEADLGYFESDRDVD